MLRPLNSVHDLGIYGKRRRSMIALWAVRQINTIRTRVRHGWRHQHGAERRVDRQVIKVWIRCQRHLPRAVGGPAVWTEHVQSSRIVVSEALIIVRLSGQSRLFGRIHYSLECSFMFYYRQPCVSHNA